MPVHDAAAVARDPDWLVHRLVDGGRSLRFVHADRAAHRAATFLDDEYLGQTRPRIDFPAAEIARADVGEAAPVHFIFHSAFARSTLLARAMDIPGVAMGLKEPIVLNDATQLQRERRLPGGTLQLVLRLLERPLGEGERVIIKPSNAANPLMADLLGLRPEARALILYRPLPAYLRSIAAKGMFGRIWARRQLAAIRGEAPFDAGFTSEDILIHTDLQAAALGWLIQHAQFAVLARAMPGRVRLLDADALVADRHAAFAAAAHWFSFDLEPARVAAIVGGPMFAEDSKRIGERFGGAPGAQPAPVDADEIHMVTEWVYAVARHVGVGLEFGPRLL